MEHRAKKSLGQNFLKSKAVLKGMVSAANITKTDIVLEIGPGKGALTTELLATGARVIAVEKDDRLIPVLQETFKNQAKNGQFTLIHGDALELDLKKLGLKAGKWKLVANIPYYITGLLIRNYLETENQPASMTILVQKEVAERVVARDGRESILSLSVKVFGDPKYGGTVSKRYFSPAPKVDSAILTVNNITHKLKPAQEKAFFEVVKEGLAHKRKTLVHNLGKHYGSDRVRGALAALGLNEKARGEELSIDLWMKLVAVL